MNQETQDHHYWLAKGLDFYNQKKPLEAIGCYDAAIRLKPDDASAYYNKGVSLHEVEKKLEAIECYDTAIRLKPDYALAYYSKGVSLFSLEKAGEAIECFDIAITFKSDDANYYNEKGRALNSIGKKLEAIECYDAAIRLKPDFAMAYKNKGVPLYDLGKKLEAIECCDEAIRLEPDFSLAYYNKGIYLNGLGRMTEALECYDNAIRLKRDYESSYINKGLILIALGREREGLKCYDTAIKVKPDCALAYFNKGVALANLGEKNKAIKCYDSAIRVKPDYFLAYYNKGILLKEKGKNFEAIGCYDAAIRFKPDYESAYINKGSILMDYGKKLEAVECYDAALKYKPTSPLFYVNRAKALNSVGREREAFDDLNKAYALMQEAQSGSISLSKENIDYINESLSKDRLSLLIKINDFQKNALEYQQRLQELKNIAGQNIELQKQIDDKFSKLQTEKSKIVQNTVDLLSSKAEDGDQKMLIADKEMSAFENRMIEEFNELKMHVQELAESKISRTEIEPHAFKISSEIQNNPNLKKYYEALYDRLQSALDEAEVICGGENLSINTSNVKVLALSKAVQLTPFVGSLLSGAVSGVAEVLIEKSVRMHAIKLKSVMGASPDERKNVIKKAAETISLNSIDKIFSIETNEEVNYWLSKGLISKCRDFFIVDIDSMLYQSKPQILGCIDALKILYAIENDQVKQNSDPDLTVQQMVLVPYSYKFSKGKKITENQKKSNCCQIF